MVTQPVARTEEKVVLPRLSVEITIHTELREVRETMW
jgi:hypothetical protein